MADFCNQCSKDMGFSSGDLAGLSKPEHTSQGRYPVVICEGCGIIQVDHEGNCVSPDCHVDHSTGKLREKRRDG